MSDEFVKCCHCGKADRYVEFRPVRRDGIADPRMWVARHSWCEVPDRFRIAAEIKRR